LQKRDLDKEETKKNKIIKFRFAPKFLSICIYEKCSMGVESLHILYSLNLNGDLGCETPAFGNFMDTMPSIFETQQRSRSGKNQTPRTSSFN